MISSNRGPGSRRRFLIGTAALALAPAWRRLPADSDVPVLYRSVPSSGERLPVIGLVAGHDFQQALAGDQREAVGKVLRQAFDLPRCVVDISPRFGRAESVVARLARRGAPGEGLFLAVRLHAREPGENLARLQQVEQTFGSGRTDLVQVDNLAQWESNYRLLRDSKAAGRIRYIGAAHYHRAAFTGLERVVEQDAVDFLQFNYSLAEPEAERRLLPLAAERGVAVIASRPFAGGYLFRALRNRPLPGWAGELGCRSWRGLLLKYVLANPAVTCVVADTSDPRLMAEHLAAGRGPLPDAARRRQLRALLAEVG